MVLVFSEAIAFARSLLAGTNVCAPVYVLRGTGTAVGLPLLPILVSELNIGSAKDGFTITEFVWNSGVFRRSTLITASEPVESLVGYT